MLGLAKFLTIWERQRFESTSTSWEFIPNTNPGLPATVALGHFWYNSSTHFTGSPSVAQSGTPNARTFRPSLPLGSVWLPAHPYYHPECALLQSRAQPKLSYSASRLEQVSGQLSDKHAFYLIRSANNGTVLNRHRRNHMSQPTIDSVQPRVTLAHGSFPR